MPGSAPPQAYFLDAYRARAQWDIGRPQPALARAAAAFTGAVLDIGCGLGDNALWLASLPGVERVAAFDLAPQAVEEARARAARAANAAAAARVTFSVGDVFDARSFGAPGAFDALLDCAVFHCIGDDVAQRLYLAAVSPLVRSGGRAVMLVFSDANDAATWSGPRRISAAHARSLWAEAGWRVDSIDEGVDFCHNMEGAPRRALLMLATRI